MTETITIAATDGTGSFSAYVAMPATTPAPAIIVIQEIFGVNADMRAKCDDFARKGYIAISPVLFWRQEPNVDLTDKTQEEWDKALALMNGMNIDAAVADLTATLDTARAMESCAGKVGCVGYCLGGKLAYLMAARSDVDSSVGYYGVGLDSLLGEKDAIKNPLMLHMAELDKFSTPEARDDVVAAFQGSKTVKTHVYKGVDHAFARIHGEHFDAGAATLANGRTDAFFVETLKG